MDLTNRMGPLVMDCYCGAQAAITFPELIIERNFNVTLRDNRGFIIEQEAEWSMTIYLCPCKTPFSCAPNLLK